MESFYQLQLAIESLDRSICILTPQVPDMQNPSSSYISPVQPTETSWVCETLVHLRCILSRQNMVKKLLECAFLGSSFIFMRALTDSIVQMEILLILMLRVNPCDGAKAVQSELSVGRMHTGGSILSGASDGGSSGNAEIKRMKASPGTVQFGYEESQTAGVVTQKSLNENSKGTGAGMRKSVAVKEAPAVQSSLLGDLGKKQTTVKQVDNNKENVSPNDNEAKRTPKADSDDPVEDTAIDDEDDPFEDSELNVRREKVSAILSRKVRPTMDHKLEHHLEDRALLHLEEKLHAAVRLFDRIRTLAQRKNLHTVKISAVESSISDTLLKRFALVFGVESSIAKELCFEWLAFDWDETASDLRETECEKTPLDFIKKIKGMVSKGSEGEDVKQESNASTGSPNGKCASVAMKNSSTTTEKNKMVDNLRANLPKSTGANAVSAGSQGPESGAKSSVKPPVNITLESRASSDTIQPLARDKEVDTLFLRVLFGNGDVVRFVDDSDLFTPRKLYCTFSELLAALETRYTNQFSDYGNGLLAKLDFPVLEQFFGMYGTVEEDSRCNAADFALVFDSLTRTLWECFRGVNGGSKCYHSRMQLETRDALSVYSSCQYELSRSVVFPGVSRRDCAPRILQQFVTLFGYKFESGLNSDQHEHILGAIDDEKADGDEIFRPMSMILHQTVSERFRRGLLSAKFSFKQWQSKSERYAALTSGNKNVSRRQSEVEFIRKRYSERSASSRIEAWKKNMSNSGKSADSTINDHESDAQFSEDHDSILEDRIIEESDELNESICDDESGSYTIEALLSARNVAFDCMQRAAGLNEKSLQNSEMAMRQTHQRRECLELRKQGTDSRNSPTWVQQNFNSYACSNQGAAGALDTEMQDTLASLQGMRAPYTQLWDSRGPMERNIFKLDLQPGGPAEGLLSLVNDQFVPHLFEHIPIKVADDNVTFHTYNQNSTNTLDSRKTMIMEGKNSGTDIKSTANETTRHMELLEADFLARDAMLTVMIQDIMHAHDMYEPWVELVCPRQFEVPLNPFPKFNYLNALYGDKWKDGMSELSSLSISQLDSKTRDVNNVPEGSLAKARDGDLSAVLDTLMFSPDAMWAGQSGGSNSRGKRKSRKRQGSPRNNFRQNFQFARAGHTCEKFLEAHLYTCREEKEKRQQAAVGLAALTRRQSYTSDKEFKTEFKRRMSDLHSETLPARQLDTSLLAGASPKRKSLSDQDDFVNPVDKITTYPPILRKHPYLLPMIALRNRYTTNISRYSLEQGFLARERARSVEFVKSLEIRLEKYEFQLREERERGKLEVAAITKTIEQEMSLLELRVYELENLREEVRHKVGEIEYIEQEILSKWGIARPYRAENDLDEVAILQARLNNLVDFKKQRTEDTRSQTSLRRKVNVHKSENAISKDPLNQSTGSFVTSKGSLKDRRRVVGVSNTRGLNTSSDLSQIIEKKTGSLSPQSMLSPSSGLVKQSLSPAKPPGKPPAKFS